MIVQTTEMRRQKTEKTMTRVPMMRHPAVQDISWVIMMLSREHGYLCAALKGQGLVGNYVGIVGCMWI
jgi:hypothetical protein